MNPLRYVALVCKADELGARGAMLDVLERKPSYRPTYPDVRASLLPSLYAAMEREGVDFLREVRHADR